MEESTVNQWCTPKIIVIAGFLDLYKFYINLQKHASNLGYKYWILRSLYMTQTHLSRVGRAFKYSETRSAYWDLSLLESFLISTFPQ